MSQVEPSPDDFNGKLWVLFRSKGKDHFEYKEQSTQQGRTLLLFTTHDSAMDYALTYAHGFKAITYDSLELWTDFLRRRAKEGIGAVAVNPIDSLADDHVQSMEGYIESLSN